MRKFKLKILFWARELSQQVRAKALHAKGPGLIPGTAWSPEHQQEWPLGTDQDVDTTQPQTWSTNKIKQFSTLDRDMLETVVLTHIWEHGVWRQGIAMERGLTWPQLAPQPCASSKRETLAKHGVNLSEHCGQMGESHGYTCVHMWASQLKTWTLQ